MGYKDPDYVKRADNDSVDVYTPNNFKMFTLKKVSTEEQRIFGTNSLKYYLKIHSGGALELNAENSVLTLVDGGDITIVPSAGFNVRFGTYAAAIATESTGYITIKDAAGVARKLMIQA